jgi:hypothetical protein
MGRQAVSQMGRQGGSQMGRRAVSHMGRQGGSQMGWQAVSQLGRQGGRQSDGQVDSQPDIQARKPYLVMSGKSPKGTPCSSCNNSHF